MELFEVTFSLIVGLVCFILGSILKIGFPAYISKKFDNIATKEDLVALTEIPEKLNLIFKKNLMIILEVTHFKMTFIIKGIRSYTHLSIVLYVNQKGSGYFQKIPKIKRIVLMNFHF